MTEPKQDLRRGRDRSNDKSRSRLFNELSVSKLRLAREESEATFRDKKQRGLILRINKSGSKSWRVQFYDKARRKMRTKGLGEFKPGSPIHLSVKEARNGAGSYLGSLDETLSEEKKKALRSQPSFETVADWYLKKFIAGQRRSEPQIRAIIKAVLPDWGKMAFEAISRPDVVELLDKIEETRGPRAADVTLATLRNMMRRYASRHDVGVRNNYVPVVVDGMARIEDPSKRARKRTLGDQEIRILFAACDQLGTFGNLCKVLLYTGQRRTLIATMRFADIVDGTWDIPPESEVIGDPKGNIECVRLPEPVLDIIAAQAELQVNEYVFPAGRVGRRDGSGQHFGSFSAFAQGKADLDKAMAELAPKIKIPPWTLHDLRRTTATIMPRLGIDDDHRERVLGHKIQGVKGTYNRYKYFDERSKALREVATLIGEILRPLTKGGNVVAIKRR